MSEQNKAALALLALLCVGLALVAYGSGSINGRWSVGLVVLGITVSWVSLRLLDTIGGKHL